MNKVKYYLSVIVMALFNRPTTWSYHVRLLKEKYLEGHSKDDLY